MTEQGLLQSLLAHMDTLYVAEQTQLPSTKYVLYALRLATKLSSRCADDLRTPCLRPRSSRAPAS